jgi:hypothetical protein
MHRAPAHPDPDTLERQARRRAGAKMGWYIHACIYIGVNLVLATVSAVSGRHWAIFPALGWGVGLAIHGLVVFVVKGGQLHERLIERERQKLRTSQEPW